MMKMTGYCAENAGATIGAQFTDLCNMIIILIISSRINWCRKKLFTKTHLIFLGVSKRHSWRKHEIRGFTKDNCQLHENSIFRDFPGFILNIIILTQSNENLNVCLMFVYIVDAV